MKRTFDKDIDASVLQNKKIALLGYGNQGRPQALNLKDSGLTVAVGLRPDSPRAAQAHQDGLNVMSPAAAAQWAEVVMLMLPDEKIAACYQQDVATHASGKYIGFAHGLCIHAGWVQPAADVNVFLVAPKAQGRGVRDKYLAGSGVPGLIAVQQDPARNTQKIAMAYASAIGCGRMGVFETTFREETECDLFSEQTVLCGGLTSLIKNAFEVLVEAGYSPEVAWFECLYEVKLIADLLHEKGITGMREAISPAARFGDLTRGSRVIDGHVKETMRRILAEIQSGRFAQELQADAAHGQALSQLLLAQDYHHPLEETFRQLRLI